MPWRRKGLSKPGKLKLRKNPRMEPVHPGVLLPLLYSPSPECLCNQPPSMTVASQNWRRRLSFEHKAFAALELSNGPALSR